MIGYISAYLHNVSDSSSNNMMVSLPGSHDTTSSSSFHPFDKTWSWNKIYKIELKTLCKAWNAVEHG